MKKHEPLRHHLSYQLKSSIGNQLGTQLSEQVWRQLMNQTEIKLEHVWFLWIHTGMTIAMIYN